MEWDGRNIEINILNIITWKVVHKHWVFDFDIIGASNLFKLSFMFLIGVIRKF